jgi:hypothetical protein
VTGPVESGGASGARSPRTARVIAFVLGLFALNAGVQVLAAVVGWSDDPPLLILLQSACTVVAAAAMVGAWRLRPWSRVATVLYGLVTGGMIVSLSPILELGPDAQGGLNAGGGMTVLIALAMSWGLHWALGPAQPPSRAA